MNCKKYKFLGDLKRIGYCNGVMMQKFCYSKFMGVHQLHMHQFAPACERP